jgi:two-component system chemotaxis response regulator CheY
MLLTILYVEDSQLIARMVCDLLDREGWRVEVCTDGLTAFNRLVGTAYYDLLLFDQELPGMGGIELTRYARQLPRYRRTPIIVLSAGEHEDEARAAGVDLFLKKPDEVAKLVGAIRRLIE